METLNRLERNLRNPRPVLNHLVDEVMLPMLARNYAASGLKQRSGRLYDGITKRGASGNVVTITQTSATVGLSYDAIPYARGLLEGSEESQDGHDKGSRSRGSTSRGKTYRVYYWMPEDLEKARDQACKFVLTGES